MERVLVTGGAGFIGSNLVEELVERGNEVVVLDDLYLGDESNLSEVEDEIEFIQGSVLDREALDEAMQGVDTVFHLAARSSSPMHKENPAQGARVNVEGFVRTVERAKEEEVDKIVYASTSSMYGSVEPPHSEDQNPKPANLYTASKMSREKYAEAYSYNKEIQTTGLRFFSVFGPHEKAKGKYANVVTQFLWKMMDDEQPVIWGDGTQERDFVYVKDVVDAIIKAAKKKDSLDGEVFNVGRGDPVTFNQVVEKLNQKLDKNIEAEHVENPRDRYVRQHRAENSKVRELLDWEPQHSFEEGLRKTVEYYGRNL
ncbi:MAG: SDR family NAD(P)-dependent oxidoreductase [Candidatus Nanohalobium sp.]